MDVLFYVAPALILGGSVFWFRWTRARVEERFRKVARRHHGKVAKAPWILYPRLVIDLEGARAQISCIHGGKSSGSTRTFAWVGCEDYPAVDLDVRRMPGRVGLLERTGLEKAGTGDRAFDESFWLGQDGAEHARELLDEELRRALLALDPRLRVHLRVGRAVAYRDGWQRAGEEEQRLDVSIRGLPPEVENVEGLVAVTQLAHARLMRIAAGQGPLARSA